MPTAPGQNYTQASLHPSAGSLAERGLRPRTPSTLLPPAGRGPTAAQAWAERKGKEEQGTHHLWLPLGPAYFVRYNIVRLDNPGKNHPASLYPHLTAVTARGWGRGEERVVGGVVWRGPPHKGSSMCPPHTPLPFINWFCKKKIDIFI